MTSGTLALSPTAPEASRYRSEHALLEFMLVGGATLVLFPLTWLLRKSVGLDAADYAMGFLTFYGAFVINDPHFAVTYILYYRNVRQRGFSEELSVGYRVRYWIAGLIVPVSLVAWAVAALALRSAQALGFMIDLMFLLVGWHYVKQGFGVLSVLSSRRGVRIAIGERRAILFHCFAGWAYAWANPAVPARELEEKGVVYAGIAHPRWLEIIAGVALAVSAIALVYVLAAKWRREKRMIPAAPLAGFLITVWSWTIYSSIDPLMRYLIPALHSIQYLYFVWLMKRNEARAEEAPPLFGRPTKARLGALALSALVLSWLLFRGMPALFDSALVVRHGRMGPADALGETPVFAAIFVVVNIHHYFMDYVIWRREQPEMRYLRAP